MMMVLLMIGFSIPLVWLLFYYIYEFYLILWFLFSGKNPSQGGRSASRRRGCPAKGEEEAFAADSRWEAFEVTPEKGVCIRGHLLRGSDPAKVKVMVFAHGLGETQSSMLPQAAFVASLGWNCVLFDFRSCGRSSGSLSTMGCLEVRDLQAVMHFAAASFGKADEWVVWGQSMGAAAAAVASSKEVRLTGLILDTVYTSVMKVLRRKAENPCYFPKWARERLLQDMVETVERLCHFKITDCNPEYSLMRTTVPVLLLHGEGNRYFSPAMPHTIYQKRMEKSLRTRLYYVNAQADLPLSAYSSSPTAAKEAVRLFLAERSFPFESFSSLRSVGRFHGSQQAANPAAEPSTVHVCAMHPFESVDGRSGR